MMQGPPADVRKKFAEYSGGGANMSADQLRRFLTDAQGESGEYAEWIAKKLCENRASGGSSSGAASTFTVDDVWSYMFSDELNPPIRNQVHHDMSAPVSDYYIFTGHNSYLTGNQLSSDCSEVPIIQALDRGVKVIELDIWPSPNKNDVHVLHGRTMTSPVSFLKCLQAIKQHAFASSHYPLVITLEDHLSPDLQAKAAEMITQTFGDLLFVPGSEPFMEFPSPDALKNRIVISTKPPKEYQETKKKKPDSLKQVEKKGGESSGSIFRKSDSKKKSEKLAELVDDEDDYDDDDDDEEDDDDDEEDDIESCGDKNDEEDPKIPKDLADQYRKLITIQAGKPKGELKDALAVDPKKVRRLSLSENSLKQAAKLHSSDLIRFTRRNLLRIYPKGSRIRSSNYNPFLAWEHGAQMVAFNMQGYGKSLWAMQGFFKANGGCGYVKKPDFLLKTDPDGKVFDPSAKLPVKKTLKVKVYLGDGWKLDFKKTDFDLFSPPDFFTRVGIAGIKADRVMEKTKVVQDNWKPIWEEEFSFPLTVPELAVLRIEVMDYDVTEKNDFGGQNCLPVSELRPGIRAVPLFSEKGKKYNNVKLLMKFEFADN